MERLRVDPTSRFPALLHLRDEARALQYFEVLRDRGQGHLKRSGKLRNGVLFLCNPEEHGAAGRIGKRLERAIEGRRVKVNHMVEYISARAHLSTIWLSI